MVMLTLYQMEKTKCIAKVMYLIKYAYDSYVAVWMVMHYENMFIMVRMSGISISCSKRCSQGTYIH